MKNVKTKEFMGHIKMHYHRHYEISEGEVLEQRLESLFKEVMAKK